MRTWLQKLNDPTRDVYERRYRLLSAVSIVSLSIWLLVALLIDGYSPRILFFGICDLLFIPTMIVTLRTGNVQRGAGASGIALVLLMTPYSFFANGGIGAGAPNWCIISIVFVTMTVRGGLRTFLLAADILLTLGCYALSWFRPELVDTFTTASAYVDSVASLCITGAMTASMFLFQLHMSSQERARLEAQQREILELNRAQNRFFSSMSHEIRTPVNTIVGLNEMILREDVSDEVAENATQVRAAGRILLHLVNDILDMSKLESGKMTLSPTVYNVGDLLSEVVGMLWVHAREKGLEFHVDVDPALPARLYGDDMRVRQILINVLNNAVKYTGKGSVTLSVQGKRDPRKGFMAVFTVSDTGMGIRKESLPYLFTAFKRVESDQNRNIEGTGLGLSIVKQFVDLMGGEITVNSVYTRGSTFVIALPQGEVGAEPLGAMDLEARHSMNRRQKYAGRFEAPEARILVVDDNAANRMVVEKLLRETRMRIDTAASGQEALVRALETQYHLIFMDHLMPGMDGIACLKALRHQTGGLSREARVVALTANADAESRQLYARSGFDGYLVKPCGGEALEEECVRLLPRELVRITRTGGEIVEESVSWMSEGVRREEIAVTMDSIADLPADILREYGIAVIPHTIRTSEGLFRDGVEIEAGGVVDYLEDGANAAAVAPTVAAYEAFFAETLSRANHVIHISISRGVPGSGCEVAVEAAATFNNVTVIDSGHLSSGQGLLAIEACRLAREGLRPGDIAQRLAAARADIHTSFIVDGLNHLERAGLVGRRAARLSEALMLRPVLRMKQGRLRISQIYLGARENAWKRYIEQELKSAAHADRRLLFVTYVGLPPQALETIRREIEGAGLFETIRFQKASPAIAVNCGPRTFGLLFMEPMDGHS